MMFKIFLLSLLSFTFCEKIRYENYTLYKIHPNNKEQLKFLQNLRDNDMRYDFWTEPAANSEFVSVLAGPEIKGDFESLLNGFGIKYAVAISNIQEKIDTEKVATYTKNNIKSMVWDTYYKLEDINTWMNDLAETYPDVVEVIVGGTSYEKRDIKGLKISHGPGRKIIFLEGGIHGREWISPATVCYIINELVTSDDEEIKAAAKDFDWYIFPVINPDGYVWTHEEDRDWRKNRRPIENTTFIGVDLNRNWNNNWLLEGSSTNPASDTYAGPEPFSEEETRTLSTFIREIGDRIDMYISFHSFGQLLLLPFGNTTEPLANYQDAINIGRRAMGALSVRYGTQYVAGNIAEAIYLATGGSVDWVKETIQVPLVYCYELRDKGNTGYLLPGEEILPNSEEVMDSLLDLIHQARRFGYINNAVSFNPKILVLASLLIFVKLFFL